MAKSVAGFFVCALAAFAQQTPPLPAVPPPAVQPTGPSGVEAVRPNYVLGANDQILIHALEVEELDEKPFRVDDDGSVTLPLVGVIKAAGMSISEFEDELRTRLKTYVRNPQVSVTMAQFRSEPVFFVGAFLKPGIYPLQGGRSLVEMLTIVGGLLPSSGRRIKVTRKADSGPIPLPGAVEDPDTKSTSVEIPLGSLTENINPAEDITLKPYDVVSVERVELVYAQGELGKIGGFELGERESLSALQLVSMAGGLTHDADSQNARILRPVLNTNRRAEIPLNLKSILAARSNDYPLMPNDVLYVPRIKQHQTLARLALIAAPLIPTILYLVFR